MTNVKSDSFLEDHFTYDIPFANTHAIYDVVKTDVVRVTSHLIGDNPCILKSILSICDDIGVLVGILVLNQE